jgi:TonB family protein
MAAAEAAGNLPAGCPAIPGAMTATTLDAAQRMAMSAPHGEPPLAGRPGPPWRLAMFLALLLAILLHIGGLWLIVEGPHWAGRPPPRMAIPVSIVMQPPPVEKKAPPPRPPAPKPVEPKPKPPEVKPVPPPPPPPPPEPQTDLRQSGPDQRTTVLRDDMEKAKGGPSPGPKAAPPPEPTAPAQPPRPAPQKPPNAKRPTPAPTNAPPRPVPSRQPQAQLGPNGFQVPARPQQQAYAPQARSRNPYDLAAPDVTGGVGDDTGFSGEGLTGDPYLNLLRDRVLRNLPKDNDLAPNRTVIVIVEINRNGTFAGYSIRVSSGQERLDRMALMAVQRAAPMPPVPPDFPGGDPIVLTGRLSIPSF